MSDPQGPHVHYRLDANDVVADVGGAFVDFARANGAPELTPELVLGRSVWDFVAGEETRALYRILYERVRRDGSSLRIPFRCDSPDRFRFMELALTPAAAGAIDCDAVLLREQARPHLRLLDGLLPRSRTRLPMCSLCKRIFVFGEWSLPEAAVARLEMFDDASPPQLDYATCNQCRTLVEPRHGVGSAG